MRVLILFAHPAFHKSMVNKVLVDGLSEMEGITFHDLYQEYPEMDIDVKREQALLEEHDCVIFHFPLFWYSTPAILKEWQDLVLEHGWAYGSKGVALKDKLFICTITSGGPRRAYQGGSMHRHTIKELLAPLRQTASLCKMKAMPPFVVHGTHAIETDEILDHKINLKLMLEKLVSNEIDETEVLNFDYMNDYLTKNNQ